MYGQKNIKKIGNTFLRIDGGRDTVANYSVSFQKPVIFMLTPVRKADVTFGP
jgi:hypothetical protein